MIDSFIAYDIAAIKKKFVLAKIKSWYKGGVIKEDQWSGLQPLYSSELYSPTIIMRVLLFIGTYFGLSSILGPFALLIGDASEGVIRVSVVMAGIAILIFTDRILIRDKKHYKSGVTEAASYTGISFVYFGLLGFDINEPLIYLSLALIILVVFSIRYLDLLSFICSIGCFITILFVVFEDFMALLPFIFITIFTILFFVSQSIQKEADKMIWEDHFIIFDTLSLLFIYLGGNYFVVRELSVEMMNLHLAEGEDIPFAFIFYAFTLVVPAFYLVWGIMKKSLLFIRVSLLVLTLTAATLKFYYVDLKPELIASLSGGLLLLVSFALIKYLRVNHSGYTRDQIFQSKWDNADLTAFIASQALSGHQINGPDSSITGQGGEFGGGGASGEF